MWGIGGIAFDMAVCVRNLDVGEKKVNSLFEQVK